MNKSQCFDLCRWETISKEEAVRLPWTGRDARINHREHRAMLYENFEYFCRACQVSLPNRKQLFEVWMTSALSTWKKKKRKFPAKRRRSKLRWRDHVGQLDRGFPEVRVGRFDSDHGMCGMHLQEHNTNRANPENDREVCTG